MSKSKSKGKGRADAGIFFCTGCGRYCAGYATATCCIENKALLIAQPLPESRDSLCKQQAFGHFLCKASDTRLAALLQNLDTHFVAVLFCHKPWAFQGIASYLICACHSLKVWPVLSPLFHYGSTSALSKVEIALWSLSTAVKSHKDRHTAAVPSLSWGMKLRFWCALDQ